MKIYSWWYNAYNKQYVLSKMCMVVIPEAEVGTKKMKPSSMIDVSKSISTEEFKRLFEYEVRIYGAKAYNKHRMRQTLQKLNKVI